MLNLEYFKFVTELLGHPVHLVISSDDEIKELLKKNRLKVGMLAAVGDLVYRGAGRRSVCFPAEIASLHDGR